MRRDTKGRFMAVCRWPAWSQCAASFTYADASLHRRFRCSIKET